MKIRCAGTVIEISLHESWITVEFRDGDGKVYASFRGPAVKTGEESPF